MATIPTAEELWESDKRAAQLSGMTPGAAADYADMLQARRFKRGAEGLAREKANARALWAVRVLDAWQREGTPRCEHWYTVHTVNGRVDWYRCNLFSHQVKEVCVTHVQGDGPTPDAARLAAAEAVWPGLPADVRAKLGERP